MEQTLEELVVVEYLQLSWGREAEVKAREMNVGLWQEDEPNKPSQYRNTYLKDLQRYEKQ